MKILLHFVRMYCFYIFDLRRFFLRKESIPRDAMKYEPRKKRNCEADVIYSMDTSQQKGPFAITMSELRIFVDAL